MPQGFEAYPETRLRSIKIGCYDGALPSSRDGADLAEERRLLYVAVTRAKKHLYLTYPSHTENSNFSRGNASMNNSTDKIFSSSILPTVETTRH
ncbi:MAG: ATP-binding domain-containing protein [Selenomonadaceae bacterium]|nr:ATP-binding domain-containing protein [Selenomonadaceae bacterium]